MFCDVVGSTALATRLDPEDLGEIIAGVHKSWEGVIKRYDGFVARYMGDGVLAYFGYPNGHEDDAERAAHAALEIVDLATSPGCSVAVRVGIATGLTVVGGSIGEAGSQEMPAFGLTPNIAAHLQAVAPRNAVVIAEGTRRLIGSKFECAEIGPCELKGVAERVSAWRLIQARATESRFTAHHDGAEFPTIGRGKEMEFLRSVWSRVRQNSGQVVVVSGEPGIGKSHLCEAFVAQLSQPAAVVMRCQCSALHANTAFLPLIEEVERSARINRDDHASERLAKLEILLRNGLERADELLPVFATLLSLPVRERYPQFDMSARDARKEIIDGLVRRLLVLSKHAPVVLIVEDLQWSDPSTQEFLQAAIERIRSAPVLILVTQRTGFAAGLSAAPQVEHLTLGRLERRHAAELIGLVASGSSLSEDALATIIERAGGVPFFVQELSKWMIETGAEIDAGKPLQSAGVSRTAVPVTLHDFLMSQLDRLGMAKPVAQLAAMIGRAFPFWLLSRLWPFDEPTLRASLAEVIAAGVVTRQQHTTEEYYQFKHELIRDAAYESLLRTKRHSLHVQVAQIITEERARTSGLRPELIAYHYMAAGMGAKAAPLWLEAGQLALRESANREARASLQYGLDCLRDMAEYPERVRLELRLQACLGQALIAVSGHASPEVHEAFSRAHQLCNEDAPELFSVVWGITAHHLVKGNIRLHLDLSANLLEIAQRSNDSSQLVVAHTSRTLSLYFSGAFEAARRHLDEVRARYEWERHRHLAYSHAVDRKMIALQFGTWILWKLGYPDQAAHLEEELNKHARRLAHPNSLAQALTAGSSVYMLRREPDRLLERVREGVRIAEAHGYPVWIDHADFWIGWALAEKGSVEEGIVHLRRALVAYQKHGSGSSMPKFLGLLADRLGEVGRYDEALTLLDQAIQHVERMEERANEAETYRLRGKLIFARNADAAAEAESDLLKAIDVARAQHAKAWELRGATTLARVLQHRGQQRKAREYLLPVCEWFREGADTPDLKEARSLLREIS
jgi:class 3 adenylate cyclase/predicted ATPase